jgi:uncharacterized protein YacL
MKKITSLLTLLCIVVGYPFFLCIVTVVVIISCVIFMLYEDAEHGLYYITISCCSFSFRKEKKIFLHQMKRLSKEYRALCSITFPDCTTGEQLTFLQGDITVPAEMLVSLQRVSDYINQKHSISKIRTRLLLGKTLNSYIT